MRSLSEMNGMFFDCSSVKHYQLRSPRRSYGCVTKSASHPEFCGDQFQLAGSELKVIVCWANNTIYTCIITDNCNLL